LPRAGGVVPWAGFFRKGGVGPAGVGSAVALNHLGAGSHQAPDRRGQGPPGPGGGGGGGGGVGGGGGRQAKEEGIAEQGPGPKVFCRSRPGPALVRAVLVWWGGTSRGGGGATRDPFRGPAVFRFFSLGARVAGADPGACAWNLGRKAAHPATAAPRTPALGPSRPAGAGGKNAPIPRWFFPVPSGGGESFLAAGADDLRGPAPLRGKKPVRSTLPDRPPHLAAHRVRSLPLGRRPGFD